MSDNVSTIDYVRLILLLGLIFLVTLFFGIQIFSAPIITILVYFIWLYRRKIKSLEGRLAKVDAKPSDASGTKPEPAASPSSTDA